ncbi:MAG: hypothetical protein KatS3mg129_1127 [Leptospiraceae bacterium]|nr:MAG: hypothetical protein KatS3mg129_1127 [Leptospiraceae bacterium]
MFVLLFCQSVIYNSNSKILKENYFFYYNNQIPIPELSYSQILKQKDSISSDVWAIFGIINFYENEYYDSEYCFLMAVKTSDFSLSPDPLHLNSTLKHFLNLIFFYELSSPYLNYAKDKQKEFIKQYIYLIQNRDDLIITTLKEIRKRNLSNLEYILAEEFYQNKKDKIYSENFLYEYIITLIHNHKIKYTHLEIVNSLKNDSLKQYLIEQIAQYFFIYNQEDYIKLYENFSKEIQIKYIKNPYSAFYLENLFFAYYNLYKKNKIKSIPESIIKNIISLRYVNSKTYYAYLDYYYSEKFLFYNQFELLTLHIKPQCIEHFLNILCPINTKLQEYKIQKEILGTTNLKKIHFYKEHLLNFF